jgi:hypothetical protein
MKKPFISLFLTLTLIIGTSSALQTTFVCPSTDLKNEIKPLLKPDYKYDSSKITRISAKGDSSLREVEVPLFIGEKYKFIFNTAQLQKDVIINVYNKKAGKGNRELLYSNKDQIDGKKSTFVWEPDKSRTMYINYEIPKGTTGDGCVVFLLGYRI